MRITSSLKLLERVLNESSAFYLKENFKKQRVYFKTAFGHRNGQVREKQAAAALNHRLFFLPESLFNSIQWMSLAVFLRVIFKC